MNTYCTFGPGIPDTCLTHAPWWAPLTAETPLWAYLATVAFVWALSWSASWLKDHYELAGRRVSRRWYGTGAWVTLRADAGPCAPDRYTVMAWDNQATSTPWLLAAPYDNEDGDAFWAAVTDFSPYAVRRFRPYLWRGWLPVLFARETFPGGGS